MSVQLQRLQAELDGLVFGHGTDIRLVNIGGLGLGTLVDREYDNAGEDGIRFGLETRRGPVWSFEGHITRAGDEEYVWNRAAAMAAVFDGDTPAGGRLDPMSVKALRMRRPGAPTRVVYGRPADFDQDAKLAVIGKMDFTATFRLASQHAYADDEQTLELKIPSASSGGIVTGPGGTLAAPLTTLGTGRRVSIIETGGDVATWPIVTIAGPVLNPRVRLLGADSERLWTLALDGSLAYDQVAVIDTRPWNRTASLADGGPLPAPLTIDSVPSRSTIPVGVSEVVVDGIDPTGTARFTIRWRDAFRTI